MGIQPKDLYRFLHLSVDHSREGMNECISETRYEQIPKNERAMYASRMSWIRWGVFAGLVMLTLLLSLYSIFVRD